MRFHMGFSFRLKDLKKFLIPILLGVLAYFGFGGLFGCLSVNAQEHIYNDYYLSYNNFYENDSYYHNNDSLTFVLYNILNYYRSHNSYYNLFIGRYDDNQIGVYLINKNATLNKNASVYGSVRKDPNASNYWFNTLHSVNNFIVNSQSPENASYLYVLPFSSDINVLTSDWFSSITNCLNSSPSSNLCTNSSLIVTNGFSAQYIYNGSFSIFYTADKRTTGSEMINNNYRFSFPDVVPYYYSSFDIFYRNSSSVEDNQSYYKKSLTLNTSNGNYHYETGDKIYSYFDIINGTTNNLNFEDYNKLGKFYIGNIPKNNLQNLTFEIAYQFIDSNYVNNLNYNILFFGRDTSSLTYYSYKQLQCSIGNNSISNTINMANKSVLTTFFNNGITCSTDLSNIDHVYVYIEVVSPENSDNTIYNLSFNSNYGNTYNLNPSLVNDNVYIYERFENLEPTFQLLLSTKDNSNSAYFMSDNKNIVGYLVSSTTNKMSNIPSNPLTFGQLTGSNALIFNIPFQFGGLSTLDMFIHYNTIISDEINGNFTYYDNTGTLSSGEVENDKIVSNHNNYNVSYYFGIVNSYIDGLSLSVIAFSELTQSFYDNMPDMLQDFLYVAFILSCVQFIYLLIRK